MPVYKHGSYYINKGICAPIILRMCYKTNHSTSEKQRVSHYATQTIHRGCRMGDIIKTHCRQLHIFAFIMRKNPSGQCQSALFRVSSRHEAHDSVAQNIRETV